jgi:hypothetical protein
LREENYGKQKMANEMVVGAEYQERHPVVAKALESGMISVL